MYLSFYLTYSKFTNKHPCSDKRIRPHFDAKNGDFFGKFSAKYQLLINAYWKKIGEKQSYLPSALCFLIHSLIAKKKQVYFFLQSPNKFYMQSSARNKSSNMVFMVTLIIHRLNLITLTLRSQGRLAMSPTNTFVSAFVFGLICLTKFVRGVAVKSVPR